ncbi:unnamed protein product [Cyclocybe aegerita]|uniref:Methylated-DNA--protein-cysteine methyltransferase n=1 Tax=Cyclocybe aegerita TaxID=1973307 RepID=A0A8S0WAY1_CYCAE|nr:unnamed protein product [Cyclocybe aegerita]
MPAQRTQSDKTLTDRNTIYLQPAVRPSKFFKSVQRSGSPNEAVEMEPKGLQFEPEDTQADCSEPKETIPYPISASKRNSYKTKTGKKLTAHLWAVYDFTLTIPKGTVTTYKDVSLAVGGSPRSVGNALRNNPFAPYVPCHRVIASNLFIGGFFGEWGKEHKTGTRCNQKIEMLASEGVKFDDKGNLLNASKNLWKPVEKA